MKKIISVLFVGLFLLNSCGYYFIFLYNRGIVQDEMKKLIHSGLFRDQSELISIADINQNRGFRWMEKDEFLFNGRLYDVISREIHGNTITFRCINDSREEQLVARHDLVRDLFSGINSPARAKNTQAMQNLLIKQAMIGYFHLTIPSTFELILFYNPMPRLCSVTLVPSSPPPRFA